MKHRRSPTHSYPQNMTPPIHAALALRHPRAPIPIPTLLSPLRFISNAPLVDAVDELDDFQSNAWVNASSYRAPLTGLGITCLRDVSTDPDNGFVPEGPPLEMQVDDDQRLPSLTAETRSIVIPPDGFYAPIVPYHNPESKENRRRAQLVANVTPSICDAPGSHVGLGLDNDVDMASDIIGLIPDVNMYNRLRQLDLPYLGVNPLDTIRSAPPYDTAFYYGEPASPTPEDRHTDNIPSTMDPRVEQSPSPRVIQDIMSILIQPVPEFPFPPCSSVSSPSAHRFSPSQLIAPRPCISTKLEQAHAPESEHCLSPAPGDLEYSNTTHSSPVLNAHLGIELNELISRAEHFRTKYPEQDIDRAWLSHFAGKLSDRGELLNDFRCYVIGCDQRNKRRDHILVHVGAHIGQRPFACSICPLRFLRKNECKRHEASHSGFRPYSCDICGQSFVRQDLVKRHVKRTHGVDENQSSARKQSRKKARAQ